MKDGNRAIIRNRFGSIYHNKTGTIVNTARKDGFILVKLDEPIIYEGNTITEEIFEPSELFILNAS